MATHGADQQAFVEDSTQPGPGVANVLVGVVLAVNGVRTVRARRVGCPVTVSVVRRHG